MKTTVDIVEVHGQYFDGETSLSKPATLTLNRMGNISLIKDGLSFSFTLDQLNVSPRLGNGPRYIDFPDGGKIESNDNDNIDIILSSQQNHSFFGIATWLENNTLAIALTLILTIIGSYYFVSKGIPSLAKLAAFELPANAGNIIAREALSTLDKTFFEPSKLTESIQNRVSSRFGQMTHELHSTFQYKLIFRKSESIGANAFALPSGIIVITDDLVNLAKHDDELAAILAHEIGHVENRHQIRRAIQDSALAVLILALTGDVSTTATLAAALPTLLVEAQYSQTLEAEADDYALQFMEAHHIPLIAFADIMQRLEENAKRKQGADSNDNMLEFLSSHPSTSERMAKFRQ